MINCQEEKRNIKGLNIYLYKKEEKFKHILKGRELHILPNNKWVLVEAIGLERTIYSIFKFKDNIKSPPQLQKVEHKSPFVFRVQSKDIKNIVIPDMELPIYDSGLYQFNDVLIEEMSVQPSCCCGKVDVLEMIGTYTCLSNEPNITEYCHISDEMIIPPEPHFIPLCDSACHNWGQIPNPKVEYL